MSQKRADLIYFSAGVWSHSAYNQTNPLAAHVALCHHTNLTRLSVITICQLTITTQSTWAIEMLILFPSTRMPFWRKEWIVTEICHHKNLRSWTNNTTMLYLPTTFHVRHVGAGEMSLKCASVGRAICAGNGLTMREEY